MATVRDSPPPALLEKNKGVMLISSDDDEDTMEGPALKRRKTTMVATSHSSSARRSISLRDNPPSASSPPNFLAPEEGAESVPKPALAPAPELPLGLQQILRGYQQEAMGNSADKALQESMSLSLGGFFARATSYFHQAEAKTKKQQALTDELAQVKEQMTNQAQRFFVQETTLTQELGALQKTDLEANKKLHDEGQKYTTLLSKKWCHYTLRWWNSKKQLRPTKPKWPASKSALLPGRCIWVRLKLRLLKKLKPLRKSREELAEQAKNLEKTKGEVAEKAEALVKTEAEMAAQTDNFEKAKAELLDDAA